MLDIDPAGAFDSVYCSHKLEHYFAHEAPKVLQGFRHVLKPDEVLNSSAAGPITPIDVLYGWGVEIERSGRDWLPHKTGFTARSLLMALQKAGFGAVYQGQAPIELAAIAFAATPSLEAQRDAGLLPG